MSSKSRLPLILGFKDLIVPPFIEITEISIVSEDRANHIYSGNLKFIDYIEHGIEGENDWEAKPGTQVFEMDYGRYLFDVNPIYRERAPFLWSKDQFTISPSIDNSFRHMIMHALLFYNPDLPRMPPSYVPAH